MLWFEKMQYDNSFKDFDAAARIFPAGAFAYIFGGIACLGRRDGDLAVKNFKEGLRRDSAKARELLDFVSLGPGGGTWNFPDDKAISGGQTFAIQMMIFGLVTVLAGPAREGMVENMHNVLVTSLIARQHEIIKRRSRLTGG